MRHHAGILLSNGSGAKEMFFIVYFKTFVSLRFFPKKSFKKRMCQESKINSLMLQLAIPSSHSIAQLGPIPAN